AQPRFVQETHYGPVAGWDEMEPEREVVRHDDGRAKAGGAHGVTGGAGEAGSEVGGGDRESGRVREGGGQRRDERSTEEELRAIEQLIAITEKRKKKREEREGIEVEM